MTALKLAKTNWKRLLFGGVVATASITYLSYSYFHKTYPQFVSLPGPFKHIGVSYHRIPNNTRFKIFYPTSLSNVQKSNSQPPNTYFTDFECAKSMNKNIGVPSFILNALNNLENASNPMPCFQNAPINKDNNHKYPLLLFSPGNFGSFDFYTQLLCGLASYGMIVAILDHTDGSALYTKLYDDNTDLYYKPKYIIDKQTGKQYTPKPWKIEHDVADYGHQRLKPVRVPEFIELYKYLTKSENIKDKKLSDILSLADINSLIFGGQSFGGATSWMASHRINDNGLKCLLLLDPWFGCIDMNELKGIKWNIPGFILSSESWLKQKKYNIECKQIVMNNSMHKNSVWEYGKSFVHYDSADCPLWGPSFMTQCRKIYTAKQWSDLLCKRSASFIADNIPQFKQRLNADCLQYDSNYIDTVNLKKSQL